MRSARLPCCLLAAFALALSACAGAPAGSVACVPQVLARLPVVLHAGVPTASAVIDGQPAWMVLDLGSTTTVLAETTADRLHLPRDPTALPTIEGMGGSQVRWAVTARRLALGGLVLGRKRLEVAAIGLGSAPDPIDGAIGLDVLAQYDVDWDLPDGMVTLTAASGCARPPPGFPAGARRVALSHPVEAAYESGPRELLLPVAVDGKGMTALLDSGAAGSLIGAAAAADIEPPAATDRRIGLTGVGAEVQPGTLHRFRSLTVAGETVAGPLLVVGPVPLWAGQMILGVAFLRDHRVWLPAGDDALWVSPRAPDAAPTGR